MADKVTGAFTGASYSNYNREVFQDDDLSGVPCATHGSNEFSWGSDFVDGIVVGDFSDKNSTAHTLGEIAGGLIPYYGQAADVRDTAAALEHVQEGKPGAYTDLFFSILGWIPLAGDWAKSARKAERAAGIAHDVEKSSLFSKMFYRPTIEGTDTLSAGVGSTDKFGNVLYSTRGSEMEQALVREHELVHSALSPKFDVLREMRAEIGMAGYNNSSLLRYLEEALAESYAQAKVNGISDIPKGLLFPIENGYVELRDVITEAALGTIVVGGIAYGAYFLGSKSNDE